MPELPEVETIRQDLRSALKDKTIEKIDVLLPRLIKSDKNIFTRTLLGNSFSDIDRVGKLFIFKLTKTPELSLLIHLKMTGQLVFCSKKGKLAGGHSDKNAVPCNADRHTRLVFHFQGGDTLFFNDLRTFGALRLMREADLEKEKARYGIEPLQKNFLLKDLRNIIKRHRIAIKALLLDQKSISGIGNIYADEILHASGIDPRRASLSLTEDEAERVFKNSQSIIKRAIKKRGTTFNNYVDGRGQKGSYVKELKVYGRAGQACMKCKETLTKIKCAGRGTVFCSSCQK